MTAKLTRLSETSFRRNGTGVATSLLTPDDSLWMRATALRLDAAARFSDQVEPCADGFLYFMSGEAQVSVGSHTEAVSEGLVVLMPEGTTYSLLAITEALIIHMMTLTPSAASPLPGLSLSGIKVKDTHSLPIVELPGQNRRRIPFVTVEDDQSERAHGMIVECIGETVGNRHHHPDSESIFLFLDGAGVLSAEGQERPVARGDIAFFGLSDPHSLRSGSEGLAFLEYHTPSRYSIVRI